MVNENPETHGGDDALPKLGTAEEEWHTRRFRWPRGSKPRPRVKLGSAENRKSELKLETDWSKDWEKRKKLKLKTFINKYYFSNGNSLGLFLSFKCTLFLNFQYFFVQILSISFKFKICTPKIKTTFIFLIPFSNLEFYFLKAKPDLPPCCSWKSWLLLLCFINSMILYCLVIYYWDFLH